VKRLPRDTPLFLLGLALAAAAVLTLVLASKMTFFADTWELLINRRDPTVDTLLQPHNEHLIAIPVLIAQLCLRLFGMTSEMPEYVVLTAFLLATAGLLYVYVKRRVGPSSPLSCCSSSAPPGRSCSGRSSSPSSAPSSSAWRCCWRSNGRTAAATSPPACS